MGVGLAGIVERIEIGHRAGGEHPLVLAAKVIVPKGQHREEPIQLTEGQPVHADLATGQLHHYVGLQLPQLIHVRGF